MGTSRSYEDPGNNEMGSSENPSEIRSFHGLMGYYRRFVEGCSSIAASLTKLTKKNEKFIWIDAQQLVFQQLKETLCQAPILTLP